MGMQIAFSSGQKQKTKQRLRTAQQKALGRSLLAETDLLNSATASQTTTFLEMLVEEGDVVQDFIPENDDLPLLDGESLYSADWDWSDEDAIAEDIADSPLPEEEGLFAQDDGYCINVEPEEDGRMQCVPPDNDWGGARGITRRGIRALQNVASRMETLALVAEWLEEEFQSHLADGPDGFLDGWNPRHQREFLDWYRKKLSHQLPKGTFSKFIRNVCLAWAEGAIPLRGVVFKSR